ncbi:helix-turn-helix domain-containing protein [Litorimonas sp. WD9-15]|uniref:helix-turn-helix domain-containing protein n=1 Tax=Litorimonas sp. WD9-15 TaxID=3418716 RepID=UPI003D0517A9
MADDQNENLDVAIGRRLSTLRETSGLTRTELASKSGYPLSEIIAHEDGSLRLTAQRMFKLCTLLGAKPADLLQGLQEDGRGGRSLHDGSEEFGD